MATAAFLVLAASADAATLAGAGTLTYTAAPGQQNSVSFSDAAPGTVRVQNDDSDPITPSGTCTEDSSNPGEYLCTGITSVVANALDGGDDIEAFSLTPPVQFLGGDGGDFLGGGNGADTLDGGSGSDSLGGGGGNDSLFGAGDDDSLFGGAGADSLSGGDGFDSTTVGGQPSANGSIDGVANDGGPGEGDNIGTDVEDVFGFASTATAEPGTVTLTGSAGTNQLSVDFGTKGTIDGGAGNDFLFGANLDDTITSRDGYADRVSCGEGNDTAIIDTLDVTSGCENVQAQNVGNANEDRPPTVAFTAPAKSGSSIGTKKATTLTATATDDRGISKVQFLDDDRIVCEDTTAPYTCGYRPKGGDVGRNTLAAIAIDSSQQTGSALRTVKVGRFAARGVSLSLKPKNDASAPFSFKATGRVRLPSGVSRSQGCKGVTVAVQVKAGKKTISNRRTKVKANCTYSQKVTFRDSARFTSNGVLTFRARYGGNAIVKARGSKRVKAHT